MADPTAPGNGYRTIFEHASEAILVIDAASRHLLDANPAAPTLFGYQAGELLTLQVPNLTGKPEASCWSRRTLASACA